MATAELDDITLTPIPAPPVHTEALEESGLMVVDPTQAGNRQGWRLIAEKVSAMRSTLFPDLEAEGLIRPCIASIVEALRFVDVMSQMGTFPPASRVIPNGEGGIVFERWNKGDLDRIEVEANRHIYFSQFLDGKRVGRLQIR